MRVAKQINWIPAIFLISYQIILLASLPFYFFYNTPSWGMILSAIVLFFITGMSITGGYHRLIAHRAYRANPIIESLILFFGAMAIQSSALRWAFEHRLHHAHVDTDKDPYSIKKGFLYAHFLWMLEKPQPIDTKVVSDLIRNKRVMFQHKHIKLITLLGNLGVLGVVGWFFSDYLGAFAIAVWLRVFVLHHVTWFINSLAHTWGEKPFSQELSAVDNYFLSMLTFGEGYHNYHHTFANDYRNGVRWFHFDPTKWMIWTLHKLGLASDLRKTSNQTIKAKIVLEHKTLLMERLMKYWNSATEEMAKQVDDLSNHIIANIEAFNKLKEQYRQSKDVNQSKEQLNALKEEIKSMQKGLRDDWRRWSELSHLIMSGGT